MTTTQVRSDVATGIKIIDADTHISEPPDLWTSRVPAKYRDMVPHIERDAGGVQRWVFNNGDLLSQWAGAASVIRRDGTKEVVWDWDITAGMPFEEVNPASYECSARLEVMDREGIWAQIVYPNLTGFGAHKLVKLPDRELSKLIVTVYNDAMAELQEESKDRLFPQALVPFWDIEAAVAEAERAAGMGLRGITMCSEPHAGGLPDLPEKHWDPLWEACSDLNLPINFHVGAGEFGLDSFMRGVWPSLGPLRSYIVGCVQIEMHNSKVLCNLLTSDLLVRWPKTKWVSVESGIGWIPYVLERLEYQLLEQAQDGTTWDQPTPTELFRRQVYACFWFEDAAPRLLLERIGVDNVLFETDFPHPTCLYPSARERALEVMSGHSPEVQQKVLGGNAARLYNLPF